MWGPRHCRPPGVGPVSVSQAVWTCRQLALCCVQPWVSSAAVGEQELHVCSGMPVAPQGSWPGQQKGQERRLAQTRPPRAPQSRAALALHGKVTALHEPTAPGLEAFVSYCC